MIFDCVIGASFQIFCDFSPTIAHDFVGQKQYPLLSQSPLLFFYIGTKMIMPTLSALLSNSPCVQRCVPGRLSAMTVHFCGPYLLTRRIKYWSYYSLHARLRPKQGFSYTQSSLIHYIVIILDFAFPLLDFLHANPHYLTSIIISYYLIIFVQLIKPNAYNSYQLLQPMTMFKLSLIRYLIILAFSISVVSPSCSCKHKLQKEPGRSAICLLKPQDNSGVRGIVTMHQKNILYPVFYEFTVGGLGKQSYHGVHIHEYGDLTEGCKSAGRHYNPHEKTHGGPSDINRHAGDLGNLYSNLAGAAKMCIADRVTTLYGERSIIGRSVVVHKNRDDLGKGGDEESTKTGNAGPRIACGVIGVTNQFKHFSINDVSRIIQ